MIAAGEVINQRPKPPERWPLRAYSFARSMLLGVSDVALAWLKIALQYAGTILQDRVLFGSDWPVLSVERWLSEFDQLGIKAEVRPKIMLHNARKLLGLDGLGG